MESVAAAELACPIRKVVPSDTDGVMALVAGSGMFESGEAAELEAMLDASLAGNGTFWLIAVEASQPCGAAYVEPERMTDGTWNLQFLIVQEDRRGKGLGAALVAAVGEEVAWRNGRILLVETSGHMDVASFYVKCGFAEVAQIPDFYAEGDTKVTFLKRIPASQ
mmetsp:Transcript_14370/g.46888  ORF Transcript_14370/g.46888 Transcript_14370/m.46888 type:complete len:165 (-) Transcript_14370:1071-1565(-)